MLGFLKSKSSEVEITVSNKTVLRVLGLVIASLLFVAAVRRASHPLTLIFVAFFLAIALNAPVHWIAWRLPGKRKGNRTVATGVSFLVVIILLAAFLASIIPPIVRQTSSFINAAPAYVSSVRDENSGVGRFVRRYHLQDQVDKVSDEVGERLKGLGGTGIHTVTRTASSVFSVLTVLVLTFMMLIEGPRWISFAKRLVPESEEPRYERLVRDMYKVIRGYVNGQVILAALAAILIFPMLIILHISYPVALLVVIFICGLIPLVGHTIGAVIVTTVALFHSLASAIIILGYYILYQQIENYVVQPRLQANSTNMSPLLVFSAVIVGVSFSGLLGGLVAIPIAGCLRIVVLDFLERRNLLNAVEAKKAGD